MKLDKPFVFFSYLLESYAEHKNMKTIDVYKALEKKQLLDFVYNSYEIYHCESINNAFADIDSLLATGKPAY